MPPALSNSKSWSNRISFAYAAFLVLWLAALIYLLILVSGIGESRIE